MESERFYISPFDLEKKGEDWQGRPDETIDAIFSLECLAQDPPSPNQHGGADSPSLHPCVHQYGVHIFACLLIHRDPLHK
jgi:hypothetical protein